MKKKANSKSQNSIFEKPFFRIILTAASTILAVLVLMFSAMVIYNVANKQLNNVSVYLFWMFVFLAMIAMVLFLRKRTKVHFVKALIVALIDITLGVLTLFAKENSSLFVVTAGLY